jgi:hypothetical protein
MNKTVFIKTVRSTGRSVWARGNLARTYEIGKRYQFTEELPAHVGGDLGSYRGIEAAYKNRPESMGGSRVLICLGPTVQRDVPCFDIWAGNWRRADLGLDVSERRTSTDFEVIGEIFTPSDWLRIEDNSSIFHGGCDL